MKVNFCTTEKIRLDDFLRKTLPEFIKKSVLSKNDSLENVQNVSNSKIRRLILCGAVSVNNSVIRRPAFELRGYSNVEVNYEKEKFFFEKQPNDIKYEVSEKDVLFEDEYLICINKPAFFPTEETIVGSEKRDCLHSAVIRWLWKKNPELKNPPYVGIMHRLDRETSGAILFTKQRSVNKDIQNMFLNHEIKKEYLALCAKNPDFNSLNKNDLKKLSASDNFTVEMFMGRTSVKSQKAKWGFVKKSSGGVYSKTEFTVLKKIKINNPYQLECFLLKASLFTGRTHQIRVHLSSKGFPILGDELYGGVSAKRIMLHSKQLKFLHPVTKQEIIVQAPEPKEFKEVLL